MSSRQRGPSRGLVILVTTWLGLTVAAWVWWSRHGGIHFVPIKLW